MKFTIMSLILIIIFQNNLMGQEKHSSDKLYKKAKQIHEKVITIDT
jgi:hypothetical protein